MSIENLEEFGQFISLHFAKQDISKQEISFNQLTLTVMRAALLRVMTFLRDDPSCKFTQLTDLTAIHYPSRPESFTLVYQLTSLLLNRRIRLHVYTDLDVPVASVTGLFPAADWYERETREMFGISFDAHPDLRKLLTTQNLSGYPLQKTFPKQGKDRLSYESGRFVLTEKTPPPQKNLIAVNLSGEDA